MATKELAEQRAAKAYTKMIAKHPQQLLSIEVTDEYIVTKILVETSAGQEVLWNYSPLTATIKDLCELVEAAVTGEHFIDLIV